MRYFTGINLIMLVKLKIKPYLLLEILLFLFFINTVLSQPIENDHYSGSHFFNIGMFSVISGDSYSPAPGTDEFRNELQLIWKGSDNEHSAINSLHTYSHFIGDSLFWRDYLSDISSISDSLKTLGDCQFIYIDTNNDSLINENELNAFTTLFDMFINLPNTDHIMGWYIVDEPSAHEYDPAELEKIYYAIKQRDGRPIYIAEAPFESDYSRFLCDILIIDYYYYTINDFTNAATLAAWSYLIPTAREQLKDAGREQTEIHSLLVLGEEIWPSDFNEEFLESHGLTHSAIRTVLNLSVDGIWFYAWRKGAINSEDAVDRWLSNEMYAEAVETEIHDREFLVTAFSNQSNSKIFVSDIGIGQSPDEGTGYIFSNRVDALASGDFQGSNDLNGNTILYDLSYRIEDGFRSNGDGDDELVTSFNNGNIYYDESGDLPNRLPINSIQGNVSAITSGDFDGDGDFEIVTAIQNGNNCKIYVSDDGEVGSISEHQIYSSDNFIVTALDAGDFDGDGRDELATAISNSQFTDSYIYIDDIYTTGIAVGGAPWYGPSNEFHITSMVSGDFNEDIIFKDRLLFALSNSMLADTRIYCTDLNNFSFDSSNAFFGPDIYWHVTAMTFGDFADDNKITKELIIAFSNGSFSHATIYKTVDPVLDGIGEIIYDPGEPSEYYVSAMTSASFRESLHPVTSVDGNYGSNNNLTVEDFKLLQNYPNPFNPATTIKYSVPEVSFVTLKVFDVLGNEITTLVNEEKAKGNYEVEFSVNDRRRDYPSGIYFYRLQADNFIETKKMILMK
ncbi:MAG: T9SS type A sorting domain-containing protein [Ignavibacterium sp.]|nr:MAG: T9SS type A sorting domain-containing protein [Ignavibacterium sp.]